MLIIHGHIFGGRGEEVRLTIRRVNLGYVHTDWFQMDMLQNRAGLAHLFTWDLLSIISQSGPISGLGKKAVPFLTCFQYQADLALRKHLSQFVLVPAA